MKTSPPAPPVLTRPTEPSPSLEGNPGHTAQTSGHRKGNRVQLDAEVVGPLGPLLQPAIHRCGHGIQAVVEVGDVIGPPLASAPGQPEPQEPSILRPRPGHFQNSKRAHGPTSNGIERLALCSGRRRSTASTNGQVPVRARPGGKASALSGFDTRTVKPVGFPEIEIESKGRAVYGDRVSAGHPTGLCMDREEHKQTGAPRPKSGESLPNVFTLTDHLRRGASGANGAWAPGVRWPVRAPRRAPPWPASPALQTDCRWGRPVRIPPPHR